MSERARGKSIFSELEHYYWHKLLVEMWGWSEFDLAGKSITQR